VIWELGSIYRLLEFKPSNLLVIVFVGFAFGVDDGKGNSSLVDTANEKIFIGVILNIAELLLFAVL
jgi:hypothetical protein